MEDGKESMSSSQAEENVRDLMRLFQELCQAGVALDNMKETSFSGEPSNASTSPTAAMDDHTARKEKEDEEEQKMAVLYIVLVLLFFSASLIVLLMRHVRREKETGKLERFYRDYLLTTHTSPVVYFDERGRPLQRKGLQMSPSRPQGAAPDATSTSSESDIVESFGPQSAPQHSSSSSSSNNNGGGFQ
ncbi:uncharacterized protein LOC123512022 [Portunus trituberculatus]|uniref:uncharacterized protein LOC123512022 n=1 Tax=Portunus trituberculatus TaxID=210409 RepID=UPI001E1D1C08|nr:uncharacterized protein LOC123512022 [Portunus trituberculatus]XP_045124093.1 uncharacterized protein LOC123512022 [Portunus trituberculatus]XP_045124094.1 uncharacterized protein LOC123512022 [Portunus trituberculatus]XP_045124095.1 uncharacterized protein LOC123512022 [Portunus trituberculatus]